MHLVINKEDILDVLSKIQGMTKRRTGLAITENLLIKTLDSAVKINVTDLITGFEGVYPAVVENKGITAINAQKLYEIIREFPEDKILIKNIDNSWIKIGDKNVEYRLLVINHDDFPLIPKFEDVVFYNLESAVLKKIIERMVIITSLTNEKRAYITGIYVEIINKDNKTVLRMVSTDGGRLSKDECVLDEFIDSPPIQNIIVPKTGMYEAIKFLEKKDGNVQIGFKDNHCIIKLGNETITIRLLEGEFPDFKEILNKDNYRQINIDKNMFLNMLKRMSILSSEDHKEVIFDIDVNRFVISSTNPEIGESKEDMFIDFEGEPIAIAYNPKFFIDTINLIDDDNIILYVLDEEHPCLLEGDEDKNYLSVIMPMKI